MEPPVSIGYFEMLAEIKDQIRASRTGAAMAVNGELIKLYWLIGRKIIDRQEALGWGAEVVARLSRDLRREFPGARGFSVRNLNYMKKFAECWPDAEKVPQLVAQIPWGQNRLLLDKARDQSEREWYVRAVILNGWSRAMLGAQIESDLYRRQGRATTNFERTLPSPRSELALSLLKDPYNFDFLGLAADFQERDIHCGLIRNLRELLLELGAGFAFVGSEVHLEVGGEDFYPDLLFYHLKLRCYVVIELKSGDFRPEHAGKLNFYVSAVDDLLRHPDDQPSIGLVICSGRNGVVAEYALRDLAKPMGIVTHRLRRGLPGAWEGIMPTIEQLESELAARCGLAGSGDTEDPGSHGQQ